MNDRPLITARLFFGLIVLALGVLWTLDNLRMIDASQILRWWPLVALAWGLMRLTGVGARPRPGVGLFWTVVGGFSLLHNLGLVRATFFDLWPVLLIAVGASLVARAWRGSAASGAAGESGSLNVFAFMAGAERKVVAQDFQAGDVTAVLGGSTVDFRSARLAENHAVVDVFAMWGGIELIVPPGWRVVGEVTPILGALVDSTAPPADPAAPTLTVRGLVVMGGVEVRNEARRRRHYEFVDVEEGERKRRSVSVGPGGVVIGAVVGERGKEGSQAQQKVYGVRITRGPDGILLSREPRPAPPAQSSPGAAEAPPGRPDAPPGPPAADPE